MCFFISSVINWLRRRVAAPPFIRRKSEASSVLVLRLRSRPPSIYLHSTSALCTVFVDFLFYCTRVSLGTSLRGSCWLVYNFLNPVSFSPYLLFSFFFFVYPRTMSSTTHFPDPVSFQQQSDDFLGWLTGRSGVRMNSNIRLADLRSLNAGRGVGTFTLQLPENPHHFACIVA